MASLIGKQNLNSTVSEPVLVQKARRKAKIRTDGDGGSDEAVVVGGGGMRGEGGWRKRERESESGRESKPAL